MKNLFPDNQFYESVKRMYVEEHDGDALIMLARFGREERLRENAARLPESLVRVTQSGVRLTPEGFIVSNAVIGRLIF